MSSMNAISYTAARENLASTMDKVCADHTPVIITRNSDQPVVMLSLEDFQSLEETAYLMRGPANAKRLLESIHALESGQGRSANSTLAREPRFFTASLGGLHFLADDRSQDGCPDQSTLEGNHPQPALRHRKTGTPQTRIRRLLVKTDR